MKKLALLIILFATTSISAQGAPTPAESEKIITKLRSRMSGVYLKFKGVQTIRNVQIKEIDTDSKKLLNTTIMRTKHSAFFYTPAQVKVLNVKINGKTYPPQQAKKQQQPKPPIPMFDSQGHKHYKLSITGIKTIGKKPCYRLQITPLKKTSRHLVGEMYFTVKGLNPLLLNGRLAALPRGLKSMRFSIRFKQKGKWAIASSGITRMRIYIPILQPDRRLHIKFTASGHRLLPK